MDALRAPQAGKFAGVAGAEATIQAVKAAPTPELAAWTGRLAQRRSPHLVRGEISKQRQAEYIAYGRPPAIGSHVGYILPPLLQLAEYLNKFDGVFRAQPCG